MAAELTHLGLAIGLLRVIGLVRLQPVRERAGWGRQPAFSIGAQLSPAAVGAQGWPCHLCFLLGKAGHLGLQRTLCIFSHEHHVGPVTMAAFLVFLACFRDVGPLAKVEVLFKQLKPKWKRPGQSLLMPPESQGFCNLYWVPFAPSRKALLPLQGSRNLPAALNLVSTAQFPQHRGLPSCCL